MLIKSVLVTGCNRGIGLALVHKLVDKTQHLFATCRNPSEATELQKVAKQHENITVLKLDVTIPEDIALCKDTIASTMGEDGLNCLINNAGQISRGGLEHTTADDMRRLYEINVIGPAMLSQALFPLLQKASAQCNGIKPGAQRAAVVNFSSILASLAENATGNTLAYRMSKSALNMLTKNMSLEWKEDNIVVLSVHPGWVQTDMGGPNASVTIEESASGIMKLIEEMGESHNGGFYGWHGKQIQW